MLTLNRYCPTYIRCLNKMTLLKKAKATLIGDKNFYHKVFAIVIPIIIQNTITNVVSMLDNVMVGRIGTLEMSAVAIVNQLIFVYALCIFGGLSGASIFSAQYAGAKDNNGLRYCMRMKLYIGTLMFLLATLVFAFFDDFLISAYLAEDTLPEEASATLNFAKEYLKIMLIGLFPFMLSQAYANTLREAGETRFPMIASFCAIFVNLIFNFLLIFGNCGFPRLGVTGAAIATVISRYVEAVVIIIYSHKKTYRFEFFGGLFKSFKIPFALCKKIIISGMPLLINEFLWSLGIAVSLQCYSVRGLNVVAAFNISNTAANLFNVAFISMGSAIAIMLGQALGSNDTEKIMSTCWKLLALSVFVSIATAIVLSFAAGAIPSVYNTSDEVRELATKFLYVVAIIMPIHSFVHGCYFTVRSGGRTLVTFLFDSVMMWGVNIPLAFVLSRYTTLPIIMVFFIVEGVYFLKGIIGFILVKKGVWIKNLVN